MRFNDLVAWQKRKETLPTIWAVYDMDGYLENVYATEEAAQIHLEWAIRIHGSKAGFMRKEPIHDLISAKGRFESE